jgi:hypothetical protein
VAQVRRQAEAAVLPTRGAPVVKLEESSDDDLYQQLHANGRGARLV